MYGPYVGKDFAKTLLEKAIILPPEAMCCAACPSTRKAPRKLIAITLSKMATSPPAMGKRGMIPAEWTTTSTPPNVASVFLKRFSTSAGFVTSACTAMACPPAAFGSGTNFSAGPALPGYVTAIANPSVASLLATALPSPPDAPVMIAVLLMMSSVLEIIDRSNQILSLKRRAWSCRPPHRNLISRRRLGIAEPLRDGAARGLETGPFVSVMKAGNRHQFALVEPDQRCIDHVFHRHNDRRGQFLPRDGGGPPG